MLPEGLPRDLPGFLERFGTDEQCREHLIKTRWPDGFRCAGCGHERCHPLRARLALECAACGKQHSFMAGTIFEQTKTGLSRWFLAIWLVTSSKGGILGHGTAAPDGLWQLSDRLELAAQRSARPWSAPAASRWPSGSRPTRR